MATHIFRFEKDYGIGISFWNIFLKYNKLIFSSKKVRVFIGNWKTDFRFIEKFWNPAQKTIWCVDSLIEILSSSQNALLKHKLFYHSEIVSGTINNS